MSGPGNDPTSSPDDDRDFDLDEEMNNPDLNLITDYLCNELDPDQRAEVERRLEEDEDFYRYCAPIIAFWKADRDDPGPEVTRKQADDSWDEFTKLARFTYQVRAERRRKQLLVGLAVITVAILVWLFAFRDRILVTTIPGTDSSVQTGATR